MLHSHIYANFLSKYAYIVITNIGFQCFVFYNIGIYLNFTFLYIAKMSIKVIVLVLEKEFDIGKVDSNSFILKKLVNKLREVCGMQIDYVNEVKVYVRLLRGNEVSEVDNCDELSRIITLSEELGKDTIYLMVKHTSNVYRSDGEKFSDYIEYAENRSVDHVGHDCVEGRVKVVSQRVVMTCIMKLRGKIKVIVIT